MFKQLNLVYPIKINLIHNKKKLNIR